MICSVVRLYCLVIKMIFLLPLFWSKSIQRFSLSTQFKASHVQQKYMLVGFRGFVYKYWKLEIMKNHMTCVRIEIWYRYSSKIMFHLICFFFHFFCYRYSSKILTVSPNPVPFGRPETKKKIKFARIYIQWSIVYFSFQKGACDSSSCSCLYDLCLSQPCDR